MYVEDCNRHGGGIATQTNEFNAFKHIVVVTYRFPVQIQRSMIQGGPRIGTNGGITPINGQKQIGNWDHNPTCNWYGGPPCMTP